MNSELLKNLNPAQKEAVIYDQGPLLIVAGAGTGKTTVLINRLAYLIMEKGISTEEILLMTFTEKATAELVERADRILPYGYVDLWINTFHGFCERILREHALDIGLSPEFKLLGSTEQWILMKKNLDKFNLDYYRPLGNPTKFIHEILRHFSRLKDEGITPAEYLQHAEDLEAGLGQGSGQSLAGVKVKKAKAKKVEAETEDTADELEAQRIKELANAFQIYNQLLLDQNFLDFGDLINYTNKLFKERPNILRIYSEKFKYVMVDEFQDTNFAQYELIKMLVGALNNLVVVGDDDQAIYKFRGASLSNIMQFKDDYPQAQEIILTANYRSDQEILDYAYTFIKNNNPNRLEEKLKINKKLQAKRAVAETKKTEPAVKFLNFPNELAEVSFTVNKIKELYQTKPEVNWSDFAILVRANDTADKYLKELKRQNLPHQFMSLKGLYYKPIILDIISYFKLLDNYHESSALFRVLNMDLFKVGYADLVNINKTARSKAWSLYEALKNVAMIPKISSETVANVSRLLGFIEKHSILIKTEKPSKILIKFLYDTELLKGLDHDADREIFSYLNQFYQKVKEFEEAEPDLKLREFMEMLNLELEAGDNGSLKNDLEDADVIKVMTVHGAKGLEFKYVFIADLVDKRFPTINRGEKISIPDAMVKEKLVDSKDIHLEEERRLFYVAITRAKDELYLLAAKDYGGAADKKVSRFIAEMGLDPEFSNLAKVESRELERDLESLDKSDLENGVPVKIEGGQVKSAKIEEKYELPARFSFSQLAAYSTCPLQYKFAFILRVPVPVEKVNFIFGRVMHDVLREYLEPLMVGNNKMQTNLFAGGAGAAISPEVLSEKRALEIYENRWQNDGYNTKEEREKYYQKGKNSLRIFAREFLEAAAQKTLPQVLFLEKDFSFKINNFILKGKIDRVDKLADGTLEVIDYKTGNPKDKLEWNDKRQLILYQLFLEEFLQIKVSRLSYFYLDNSQKISFTAKDKDMEKMRAEIIAEITAIMEQNFAPTPSEMWCKFCDFNGICEFRKT